MKKLTAIFLCFAMALSLAACGNTTSSTSESSTPESSVPALVRAMCRNGWIA